MQSSITENDFLLAKKSVDLERIMSVVETQQISELVRQMMGQNVPVDDNDWSELEPHEGPPDIELDRAGSFRSAANKTS